MSKGVRDDTTVNTNNTRFILGNFLCFVIAMSRNYKFHNPNAAYFVSFAKVYWLDVFVREVYFEVLIDSIDYCRKHKEMELYAYCFMSSHVHLLFRSSKGEPAELLRDFKRHTSKKIIEAIENNPQESRREWLLWMFRRVGEKKTNVSKYQFWQHHNRPIELWSQKVIIQKLDYIHKKPFVSGFVTNPID